MSTTDLLSYTATEVGRRRFLRGAMLGIFGGLASLAALRNVRPAMAQDCCSPAGAWCGSDLCTYGPCVPHYGLCFYIVTSCWSSFYCGCTCCDKDCFAGGVWFFCWCCG